MTARHRCILVLLAATFVAGTVTRAEEVHTNGTGGGAWSDPATWRDNAVPSPDDTVVIAADDAVTFDREVAAGEQPELACKELYVDPDGLLTFKPGKRLLALAGPLESYGLLKLDASESADDRLEIRFTGADPAQRALKLGKGGALLATGRPKLWEGRRNVVIRSDPPPPPPPPVDPNAPPPDPNAPAPPPPPPVPAPQRLGSVETVAGTSLDLRDVHFDGIAVKASTIDNTGAKPNERLNISDCKFTAAASIALESCDTPAIVNNTFEYEAEPLPFNAIAVSYCPLAEIRGNSVSGKYTYGIFGYQQTDTVVSGNVLNGCSNGVYWVGSNDMIKGLVVRDAAVGVVVTSTSGALEDVTFDNCVTGLSITPATVQATSLRFLNVPKDGVRIHFVSGAATLVNCDVTPEQIKMEPTAPVTPAPRVQSMQYCVVAVKGTLPPGAAVMLATANPPQPLAPGAADLNVRNAPAAVQPAGGGGGLTPLPKSLKSLIVKTWVIEGDGRVTPAPQYNVSVTTRAEGPDQQPTPVKTVTVTPEATWYRAKPNDSAPTLEITIP